MLSSCAHVDLILLSTHRFSFSSRSSWQHASICSVRPETRGEKHQHHGPRHLFSNSIASNLVSFLSHPGWIILWGSHVYSNYGFCEFLHGYWLLYQTEHVALICTSTWLADGPSSTSLKCIHLSCLSSTNNTYVVSNAWLNGWMGIRFNVRSRLLQN